MAEEGSLNLQRLVHELRVVVDWFSLGLQLGVPYEELKKISVECRNNVEHCKARMLNFWLNNSSVSHKQLVASLHSIGHGNLAAKLQVTYGVTVSPLDESRNPTESKEVVLAKYMIQQEDVKTREHYAQFMLKLQELLEENKVHVNDIKLFFSCLQRDEKALTVDMRRANSIPSFMLHLSRTQSWWDFKTSSTIACCFGRDKGLELVELYEAKLRIRLLKRITLKLPIVSKAKEIVVKIDRDHENYTEKNIREFRNTVSRLLKLDPWDFIFLYAEDGCIELTFLFPSIYMDRVERVLITHLEEHDVVSLSIDGDTLWSRTQKEQKTWRQKKEVSGLTGDIPIGGKNASRKTTMKPIFRGGDLFETMKQHPRRCPKIKQCFLALIIVFSLVIFYYLYQRL